MLKAEGVVQVEEEDGLGEGHIRLACGASRIVVGHCVPKLLSANRPAWTIYTPCGISRKEDGQITNGIGQVSLLHQHDTLVVIDHGYLCDGVVTTFVGGKQVNPLPTGIDAHLLHDSIL